MPKWTRPVNAPAPLFANKPERDFQKQLVDEITEFVLPGKVLYYAVDRERTNFHPLYGEAQIKNFLPPIRIYALVEWSSYETKMQDSFGLDRKSELVVHFHRRRLTEDQNLYVR